MYLHKLKKPSGDIYLSIKYSVDTFKISISENHTPQYFLYNQIL